MQFLPIYLFYKFHEPIIFPVCHEVSGKKHLPILIPALFQPGLLKKPYTEFSKSCPQAPTFQITALEYKPLDNMALHILDI